MKNNAERILGLDELSGFTELAMKPEALREVRRLLKSRDITGDDFNKTLNVILAQVDKLKSWTPLVEAAYLRVPEREREHARFMLVSFRNCIRDYEGVLQLLPPPEQIAAGEFGLIELCFGMGAAMSLKKMELAENFSGWFPKAMQMAESPTMRFILGLTLADFFTRTGKWEDAVALFESVQKDRIFCRDAVKGIVEIHAFHALLAINNGLTLVKKFNCDFEPEMEMTLPGNDKKIQQQTEKQFRKWRKILEKVVPEKRQKELGLELAN